MAQKPPKGGTTNPELLRSYKAPKRRISAPNFWRLFGCGCAAMRLRGHVTRLSCRNLMRASHLWFTTHMATLKLLKNTRLWERMAF